MLPLSRYFIWFFVICFIFTCICGVLAALLPMGMGAVLTIVPYLVAMIWVLFKFLKFLVSKGSLLAHRNMIGLWAAWVAQSIECLPLAQVMILGSWDQVPCGAPCSAGSLILPLPLPLPLLVLSLSGK